jgi:lipoprotein NlpD
MLASGGPPIGASALAVVPTPEPTAATLELDALLAPPPQAFVTEYQSTNSSSLGSRNAGTLAVLQQRLRALGLETAAPEGVTSSQAAVTPTPGTRADDCEPHPSGLYCIYTVKAGDTLSVIAADFGLTGSDELSPAEMLAESNKPDVVDSDTITVGFKLRIPVVNGIIYTVFRSETLADVAGKYGVTPDAIEAVDANQIDDPSLLVVGQEILVPDPVRITTPAPPADAAEEAETPAPEDTATPQPEESATPTRQPEETATPETKATAEPTDTPEPTETPVPATTKNKKSKAQSSAGFIWPASGPISSYFGPSHPLGIDIDFFADPNQPVVAVADGTVTFAGGDPCCSYGYYVIVDHHNGFETLYAHLSEIDVVTGQNVKQGQVLGLGGRTGNHLHFEVHLNGVVVDPLKYLP